MVLWRPTRPFRTNSEKRCPFPYRGLECKSRKTPGVTSKFDLGIRNEARQSLIKLCQENTLVIANTLFQQPKRLLYTWSKCFLLSWLQPPFTVILDPKNMVSVTVSTFSPSICHEVMGLDNMILVFECWVLIQLFHPPLSPSRGSLVLHFLLLE